MSDYLIPSTVETTRLRLRMLKDEDWRALHEHYSDETCTKFTSRKVFTEGETWRVMAGMLGHWLLRGYGPYAVEEKATGNVLGAVGLWYPNDWPEPEIKWALVRKHWGQGFASEAARTVQQVAAEYLPTTSLISLIDANNIASIQVATTVGAVFEKELAFRNGVWHVYRHPKLT